MLPATSTCCTFRLNSSWSASRTLIPSATAFCADSRVSTGTYIANRVSDKVRARSRWGGWLHVALPPAPPALTTTAPTARQVAALHDSIFMCRSGSAADTQAISDYVRYYLASHATEVGRAPTVKTAATLARRMAYENKVRPPAPAAANASPSRRDPAAILSGAPVPPPADARSTKPGVEPFTYFVQVGAFARPDEAEQQRARVSLMGMPAKVSEREQSGRTVYRVRVGP